MIHKHQLCKTIGVCQPDNGGPITGNHLLRVLDIYGNKVELVDQRGYRYIVDQHLFGGDNDKFMIIDEEYFGLPNHIFLPEDEEPIADIYAEIEVVDVGDYYTNRYPFVVKSGEDLITITPSILEVVNKEEFGNDVLVGFLCDSCGKHITISVSDMVIFGFKYSGDINNPPNLKDDKTKQTDESYTLYLKAFIHVKSGGVFDMLDTDYTERELRIIATAVCDSKLDSYPQMKDEFTIDWKVRCIN